MLLTHYIEEIRRAKFNFDLLLEYSKETKYAYNNTEYLSPYDKTPNKTDKSYNDHDPFQIFNDNIHRNLVLVDRFIIRPAFEALKTQMQTSIDSSVSTFQTIYIIIFSIFIASLCLFYMFLWRPFENGLNQTVNIFKIMFLDL